MKTPEQLKGVIRNFAAKNNLRALDVQHMFMFERILERLAVSPYAQNFILKSGLLISSMIGDTITHLYLKTKQFRLWRILLRRYLLRNMKPLSAEI